MKNTLLDTIQDGLIDIKTAITFGKTDKAIGIAQKLLEMTYIYDIGNYLDSYYFGTDEIFDTKAGYVVKKSELDKKGAEIL